MSFVGASWQSARCPKNVLTAGRAFATRLEHTVGQNPLATTVDFGQNTVRLGRLAPTLEDELRAVETWSPEFIHQACKALLDPASRIGAVLVTVPGSAQRLRALRGRINPVF